MPTPGDMLKERLPHYHQIKLTVVGMNDWVHDRDAALGGAEKMKPRANAGRCRLAGGSAK